MPEQIQPTTHNQILTGKTHNLTDFFAVFHFVAVHGAMLASGLILKGATQAAFKGIEEKSTTFPTDRIFL